jgi:hypothetical protein
MKAYRAVYPISARYAKSLSLLYAETHYLEPLADDFGSFAIHVLGWLPPFFSLLTLLVFGWALRSFWQSTA